MNPGDVDLSDPDLYVSKVPHEIFTWLRRRGPGALEPGDWRVAGSGR